MSRRALNSDDRNYKYEIRPDIFMDEQFYSLYEITWSTYTSRLGGYTSSGVSPGGEYVQTTSPTFKFIKRFKDRKAALNYIQILKNNEEFIENTESSYHL